MNTDLKKAYEIVRKEYFIQDFLEAVKSRGGIGNLLYEEVKKEYGVAGLRVYLL